MFIRDRSKLENSDSDQPEQRANECADEKTAQTSLHAPPSRRARKRLLDNLEFLDPIAPKKLMPRLNALFNRADVTQEEIHILRGIAKSILQLQASKSSQPVLPNKTVG